jgi:hypothetical protein
MDSLDALAQKRLNTKGKQYDKVAKEYHELYSKIHNETYEKFCDELRDQGNGAKGIVVVGWQYFYDQPKTSTDFFHAYNYEVMNNTVMFYDSQSTLPAAKSTSKIRDEHTMQQQGYFMNVDPREWNYMRTDNLEPSEKITSCVVSKDKVK